MRLRITSSIVVTVVWALGCGAIAACKVWCAIAGAIVALAIGLIAASVTRLHGAVVTRPTIFADTLVALKVTVVADVLSNFNLGLALNTNKSSGAQTVALMALAAVGRAVIVASLFLA
jgi:hypothetical protein